MNIIYNYTHTVLTPSLSLFFTLITFIHLITDVSNCVRINSVSATRLGGC